MSRAPGRRLAFIGGALIAVTYGLARFVLGLFLPEMRAELGFDATAAGLIGALPFLSYGVAILAAPAYTDRLGLRVAAAGTGVCALIGLAVVAVAPGPLGLGLGVLVCGVSTGLSSPVLAQAVQSAVAPPNRGRTNAAINAATSIGIAAAAPGMLVWVDAWRTAYLGFAAAAAVAAVAIALALPPREKLRATGPTPPVSKSQRRSLILLSALSLTMGALSAVYWVFAPSFAAGPGGLPAGQTAWLWLAVGIGGLAGALAGDMRRHWGLGPSHALSLAALAGALGLLALAPAALPVAILSAALFGAAYMALTGLYLVASTEIVPARAVTGPVGPFLGVSLGQFAGSAASGAAIDAWGPTLVFGSVAGLAALVAALSLPVAARVAGETLRGVHRGEPGGVWAPPVTDTPRPDSPPA